MLSHVLCDVQGRGWTAAMVNLYHKFTVLIGYSVISRSKAML